LECRQSTSQALVLCFFLSFRLTPALTFGAEKLLLLLLSLL
jgi:hypothetical protein